MSLKDNVAKGSLEVLMDYVLKDPENRALQLLDWVDRFSGNGPDGYKSQRQMIRTVLEDPGNNYYQMIMGLCHDIDHDFLKHFFVNYFLNAVIDSEKKRMEAREKYQCNIPWAILMDPTSACNLHCIGCWAAEYGDRLNLTYEDLDRIIQEGKEIGVYMYIYTGGEPTVRKDDLFKLCRKHPDCMFLAFTNATLIDQAFADQMLEVKNFIPAISVEGGEETTDARRGKGTFKKVMRGMKILKENHLPFGTSSCYTSQNIDTICTEEYVDSLIEWGAKFSWFFHYMPVGNDASVELLPDPDLREKVYHWIRWVRSNKPIFAIDFQNDAKYVGGCIAGGRCYLHINANGDVDPCVFIHYSTANIHTMSLVECLQSPLFMAYHDNQPFNKNMLRPCPMLENPECLRKMVKETGAISTDPMSPERVDHLCDKTEEYARNWQPRADELWDKEIEETEKCREYVKNAQ